MKTISKHWYSLSPKRNRRWVAYVIFSQRRPPSRSLYDPYFPSHIHKQHVFSIHQTHMNMTSSYVIFSLFPVLSNTLFFSFIFFIVLVQYFSEKLCFQIINLGKKRALMLLSHHSSSVLCILFAGIIIMNIVAVKCGCLKLAPF